MTQTLPNRSSEERDAGLVISPPTNSVASIRWQTVLTEHDRWLRTVLFARLGDRHEVEEVMQEVALAAVRQSAPIRDPQKVSPWLYRLAIRQALQYRRKCGRRRKLLNRFAERSPLEEEDPHSGNPLDWLLAEERRSIVRSAMEDLRPGDAQVLLLKYTEDWSYRQIAENLGVSESAVETRLHRARRRLRKRLETLINNESSE